MSVPIDVDPDALARAHEIARRRVSAEELRRAEKEPLGEREREEILALFDWFCRRYPTPADRLAYVRRAHARWTRGRSRSKA